MKEQDKSTARLRKACFALLFLAAAGLFYYSTGRVETAEADGSAIPASLAEDPMGGA